MADDDKGAAPAATGDGGSGPPARKPHAGMFKKGVSGNPSGKPRGIERFARDFRNAAKPGDAGKLYAILMAKAESDDKESVKAIELLLAYLAGKPTQHIELSARERAEAMTDAERAEALKALTARVLARQAETGVVVEAEYTRDEEEGE